MTLFLLLLVLLMFLGAIVLCLTAPLWRRVLYCPWCWQDRHIRHWYPERWSSTICPYHSRKVLAAHAARRRRRTFVSGEVS